MSLCISMTMSMRSSNFNFKEYVKYCEIDVVHYFELRFIFRPFLKNICSISWNWIAYGFAFIIIVNYSSPLAYFCSLLKAMTLRSEILMSNQRYTLTVTVNNNIIGALIWSISECIPIPIHSSQSQYYIHKYLSFILTVKSTTFQSLP